MNYLESAADEMFKIARVQHHLALHRYVSHSASPNEITYLKSLGLIPRKGGNKFKSSKHMPKLAEATLQSMMDELEKISATDAGFTLKGGRPIKSSEFTVMVQGRSPVTGKPIKFKQNVGGHGRSITVSDEIPAAPAPTSASTNLQSPKADGDEK
ncbi:MAG: hypothetical protein VXZ72_03110 [Chlamydiota bacterium]|nr:hypothetical protein [Chlamydiota bacterium]